MSYFDLDICRIPIGDTHEPREIDHPGFLVGSIDAPDPARVAEHTDLEPE